MHTVAVSTAYLLLGSHWNLQEALYLFFKNIYSVGRTLIASATVNSFTYIVLLASCLTHLAGWLRW
jgi:hypothetical protein